MTTTELAALQRGFLLGRGFTKEQVDGFEATMRTLPSVRPAGPPIGCATDTDDNYPTTENGSRP